MSIGLRKKVMSLGLVMALSLSAILSGCAAGEKEPYSEYNLDEYIKLGQYKGIEVTRQKVEVTDAMVDEEIQSRLSAASEQVEKKEGTCAEGDTVRISYQGTKDGKPFENGTTGEDGTVITIGSSGYIDGFDQGVVGMKVGEEKDLNLTFPENYHVEDLKGQDVVFHVKLLAIMEKKVPEFNMDFVKANSKAKSIEEYKKSVKKELLQQKKEESDENLRNAVWEKVLEGSEILKYPEEEIKKTKESNKEYYENLAQQYNMSLTQMIKEYTGMDEKSFEEYQQQYAESIVKQELALFAIARAENLQLTESEYKERLQQLKKDQGVTDEGEFKKQYGKTFEEFAGKDNLKKSFLLEKVVKFLLDEAKIAEEK